MHRKDVKVFIASSGELMDERKESGLIILELNKRYPHLHFDPVLYELDTASGNNPGHERLQDKINTKLDPCDIVVVMFYSKVGEFTKEEYDRAKKQKKKIFLYLKKGFSPTSVAEGSKYAALLTLKEAIENESDLRFETFEKLTDFNGKLYKDLQKHIDEYYPLGEEKTTAITAAAPPPRIPLPPRPYYAPAFGMPKNFTGRTEEMNLLSKWFLIDKEPICIIEAIGGMGKSSLTWKWLQDEIVENRANRAGVLWWSFYKQGFNEFLEDAFAYCCHGYKLKKKENKLSVLSKFLSNNNYLIVMDGFETQLRGYAGMMGVFQDENLQVIVKGKPKDIYKRECTNPKTENFLKNVCSGKSKILITSRLFPVIAERLNGIKHILLTGLSTTDALDFFKNQKIEGSPSEILRAAKIYGSHPLMLNHLAVAVTRNRIKHINEAYNRNIIDEKEPQKILNSSYAVLDNNERELASTLSVFRTPFGFEAVQAIFPKYQEDDLWQTLTELTKLGFLSYEDTEKLFDFHPVNRFFLYAQLTNKREIHRKATQWWSANQPEKEDIKSFEDLMPVYEQVFHLINAGLLKEAYAIYIDRLYEHFNGIFERPIEEIDLLSEFIKDKKIVSELFSVSEHANLYICLGISLYNTLRIKDSMQYFSDAACLYSAPYGHHANFYNSLQLWGSVLKNFSSNTSAKIFLLKATANISGMDRGLSFRRMFYCTIKQVNGVEKALNLIKEFEEMNEGDYPPLALYEAKTLICLEGDTDWNFNLYNFFEHLSDYTSEIVNRGVNFSTRGIVSNYILIRIFLAKSILQLKKNDQSFSPTFDVRILESEISPASQTILLKNDNALEVASYRLEEALQKIRETNLIWGEPEVLLLIAQVEWTKMKKKSFRLIERQDIISCLDDALQLAKKSDNHQQQIDIYLFCAEILIEIKDQQQKLLNLTAKLHLQKAQELSLDKSDLSDLFRPKEMDIDQFYRNIPEYQVLKRGLTPQERIEYGNYVAWKKADDMLKLLS